MSDLNEVIEALRESLKAVHEAVLNLDQRLMDLETPAPKKRISESDWYWYCLQCDTRVKSDVRYCNRCKVKRKEYFKKQYYEKQGWDYKTPEEKAKQYKPSRVTDFED